MVGVGLERSMRLMREREFTVDIVERWNPWGRVKNDLFGVIDLVAIKPGLILGVQSTTKGQVGPHLKKILAEPRALMWLRAGAELWVHGWYKEVRGARQYWMCKEVQITPAMFEC